jgi:hypothetical protein
LMESKDITVLMRVRAFRRAGSRIVFEIPRRVRNDHVAGHRASLASRSEPPWRDGKTAERSGHQLGDGAGV